MVLVRHPDSGERHIMVGPETAIATALASLCWPVLMSSASYLLAIMGLNPQPKRMKTYTFLELTYALHLDKHMSYISAEL